MQTKNIERWIVDTMLHIYAVLCVTTITWITAFDNSICAAASCEQETGNHRITLLTCLYLCQLHKEHTKRHKLFRIISFLVTSATVSSQTTTKPTHVGDKVLDWKSVVPELRNKSVCDDVIFCEEWAESSDDVARLFDVSKLRLVFGQELVRCKNFLTHSHEHHNWSWCSEENLCSATLFKQLVLRRVDSQTLARRNNDSKSVVASLKYFMPH